MKKNIKLLIVFSLLLLMTYNLITNLFLEVLGISTSIFYNIFTVIFLIYWIGLFNNMIKEGDKYKQINKNKI